MSEAKRLHPATIILGIVKGIRDSIFLIILFFVTLFNDKLLYAILAVCLLFALITITSILSWRRFSYRVEEDELRLEYGIFVRKKRYISKNRIQSIDLTQDILHRIFKLVKVEIETAGTGAEAEASLAAVTLSDGEALRAELKSMKQMNLDEEEVKVESPKKTISRAQLILAGATSGSIGVILAIAGFASSEIERFIPDDFYDTAYKWVIGLGLLIIVAMVISVLLFLWLLGIAGTVIKYWNFTITKNDKDIVITRGLLEKKQITIPLNRIQAVGYEESLIRQPFGYATVIAEIAGGTNDKGEDHSTILFPILKVSEVDSFLKKFLPDYEMKQNQLIKLPKRALKYHLLRVVIPLVILLVVAFFVLPQFIWVPVVLLALGAGLGFLRFRDTGYVIQGKKFLLRYRLFSRVTMMLYHRRIQAANKKQHLFHRMEDLATLKLSIIGKMGMGTHFSLKELDVSDADEIAEWFSYRKKAGTKRNTNH